MASVITGVNGGVCIGTNKVAKIESYKLSFEGDSIDTTSYESGGWSEKVAGLKSASVSFDGSYVNDDTNGQTALYNAFINGTILDIKLMIDATNFYKVKGFVKKLGIDHSVKEKVKGSWDIEITGAPKYNQE